MSHFALAIEPPLIMRQLDVRAYGSAAGADLASVRRTARDLAEVFQDSIAVTYRDAVFSEAFRMLAEQWRRDTRFESSLTAITEHPAYQRIIAMGAEVVPLLLGELRGRNDPELWFTALREITREDPVPREQWGDTRAMADAWLRWGQERGLLR